MDSPSFSGFEGIGPDGQDLESFLTDNHVTEVHIVGIATDYCVKATALDAIDAGFQVNVIYKLTAAVGGKGGVYDTITQINAAAGIAEGV